MSMVVKHKRSSINNAVPTSDQLDYGELAINYYGGGGEIIY